MELSYFISMVQYEVLKSFDFNKYLQDQIETDTSQPIQLAMEAAEIEIPLIFSSMEKDINPEEIAKEVDERGGYVKTHIDVPFSKSIGDLKIGKAEHREKVDFKAQFADKVAQKKKASKPKKKVRNHSNTKTANVIGVEVANPKSKKDESFDPNLIGRIKIIIKPVTA